MAPGTTQQEHHDERDDRAKEVWYDPAPQPLHLPLVDTIRLTGPTYPAVILKGTQPATTSGAVDE